MSAGSILTGSLRALSDNRLIIAPLLLLQVPALVMNLLQERPIPSGKWLLASTLSGLLLATVVTAAIMYVVVMRLRGQSVATGSAMAVSLRRVFPMIGVHLAYSYIVGFGTLMFVVPGAILGSMYFLAAPASVIDAPGFFAAFERSARLTHGYKQSIFGAFLGVCAMAAILMFATKVLGDLTGRTGANVAIVAQWVLTVFFGAWTAAAAALTYHEQCPDEAAARAHRRV